MDLGKYFWKLIATIIGLITFAVVGTILLITTGCNVTKKSNSYKSDTANVKKADSGSVKKEVATSKNESEWWREYLYPPQPVKETTEKILQPIYNNTTQPIIIREGGRQSNESNSLKYDSTWKKELDSLKATITTSNKQSKTQVLSFWQMIGLGIGGGLFVAILSKITSKFKIVRT
jgi:hypothetical protein